MRISKPGRVLILTVLIVFSVFTFRGTIYAVRPPDLVHVKIELQGEIKYKKEGKKIIPEALILNGRSFPLVKQGELWGVKAPLKQIVQESPECLEAVHLVTGEAVMLKVRDLLGGDRAKAEQFIKDYKEIDKKVPETASPEPGHGPFGDPSTAIVLQPSLAEDAFTQRSMEVAYNRMLNSEAFLYPAVQPSGLGGWWFVNEEDEEEEEEEEDSGGLLSWLGTFLVILAFAIVPILAAIWVATTAVTLAALAIAALTTLGAQAVASLISANLYMIDDLLSGQPFIEIY
jgi:hypothetical protein